MNVFEQLLKGSLLAELILGSIDSLKISFS